MESLYLLIPVSILFVILIGGVLAWAVMSGQFDGLDAEGRRILEEDRGVDRLHRGGSDTGGSDNSQPH